MKTKQVKIQKCQYLVGQIREIDEAAVQVVPFVVDALETISKNFSALQDTLRTPNIIGSVQVQHCLE